MKSFLFSDPTTCDFFVYLMREHRAFVKDAMLQASQRAANSYTGDDPDSDADVLRDDDERVFERLAERLEELALDEVASKHGAEELNGFWGDLFWQTVSAIDFRCVAHALYLGVEPPDPVQIPRIADADDEEPDGEFDDEE